MFLENAASTESCLEESVTYGENMVGITYQPLSLCMDYHLYIT
jgi:hypothetical protein